MQVPEILNHLPHSSSSTPAHLLQSSIRQAFPISPPNTSYTTITSLSHLQRKIISARSKNHRIKATSTPNSRSSYRAHSQGTLILSTASLNAITRTNNSITAQAGVRLSALPIPVVPPRKCVGSAIANILVSYGGFSECLVSDALLAISIVDSRGRLRVYTKRVNEDMFHAVVHSYGMAGVIYDATFVATDTQRVVCVERSLQSMGVVSIDGLQRVVDGNTAAEITWIPFNSSKTSTSWEAVHDNLVVKTVTSTMLELTPVKKSRYLTIPEFLTHNLYQLSSGGYSKFEAWHTRYILANTFDISDEVYVTTLREAVNEEHESGGTVEESVLFPLCLNKLSDWARIVSAWEYVVNLVAEDMERGIYRLNVLMKLRFIGGETENECVLTIVSATGTSGWSEFAGVVLKSWTRMGGRWAMNRGGVRGVDIDVGDIRIWVRSCGLDDCGMFEDDVVGFDDVRVVEGFDRMSIESDEQDYVDFVITERNELWWVWIYVVAYGVMWCWLFGRLAFGVDVDTIAD